jgi:GGDEF domain-containing protein
LSSGSNFTESGKGFLNPSLYLPCGAGGKHVTPQFQPQNVETQAASGNPRGSPCWIRAQQYGSELSLPMIDVDHFKLFNDTYGHPEGDACLGRLGETLAAIAAKTMGFAARYGGEEFCLLLPNTESPGAGERRNSSRRDPEPGDASLHLSLSNRHLQRRRGLPQAKRRAAARRPDRGRRRRSLRRQASRPQRRGPMAPSQQQAEALPPTF